ncbi:MULTISPECIES: class I SAM-dependent methyltransferase [Thermomonosporaceae]|uniref:class I SAM-dependent methyltransferase n=1 Tax=Thermomonosporaceae TaxID=2012 RepID=UPI00255B122F|nr:MULTISPECIES: class I SAM-dependent methyltransferase [Thermomonosporaceae]MDL4776825.1 class I SAM-dependent methyltransferase [Actinomadura xylanilytica]
MITPPSGPEGDSETGTGGDERARASHLQRQVAEGFGADAGRYDRARPTYPVDLVERVIAASPGSDVLDVGCGTGISARLFAAAGCQVLGVDPDPRMAELARRGGTETEVAKFEDWDPAGRTFDTVVAAQAWHWVDPVAGAAKAAAVLRPGGRLAVFWNAFDPPKDLREAFAGVFRRVLPDSAPAGFWARPAVDTYRAGCARVADVIRQAGTFGEPEEWLSSWERPYTRDEWLDLVPTTGGFTRHPEAVQQELLDGLGAAVDAAGGTFTMSCTTIAATAARLAS